MQMYKMLILLHIIVLQIKQFNVQECIKITACKLLNICIIYKEKREVCFNTIQLHCNIMIFFTNQNNLEM